METTHDLGHVMSEPTVSPSYAHEAKAKKYYPSLSLNSTEFPPVKDWAVGKTYTLTITVLMTGQHQRGDGRQISGDFDVRSARVG